MSQHARVRAQPSAGPVIGNTARTLNSPAPETAAPQPRRRTPLVLVPSLGSKRRTPFVVFCFFTLVAALGSVLVLNVSVSSGQYRLVELNDKQVALAQENEMLTQMVKNHAAPQNLAAAAAELGMVASPSFGSIDLQSGKIAGDPKSAKEADGAGVLVPAPDVAIGQQPAEPPAPAEKPAPPAEKPAPPAEAADPEVAPNAEEEAAAPQSEPSPQEQLNGGTIPAPQQRTGD